MTEKEELILVKMLFKAIKKKDISTMTELTEKVDMTDQEMINSYLFKSMKSKNIVSFNYFLNKLDDINNYLIRRIFSKKNNEPYKESVLKHIQHFPQNYSSLFINLFAKLSRSSSSLLSLSLFLSDSFSLPFPSHLAFLFPSS